MIPLTLSRPLCLLDLETTGLNAEEARIVEIGMLVFYPEDSCPCGDERVTCIVCNGTGRTPTFEWRTLVNPLVPIPAVTSEVHGITDENVKACQICGRTMPKPIGNEPALPHALPESPAHVFKPWPTFAQLAGRLANFTAFMDYAGKHVRYDLRVLDAEMRRAKAAWHYADAAIICADAIERVKEPRDLSTLYTRRTGKQPHGAHHALDDVKMTAELLAAQLALWPDLPRTPAELHKVLWDSWIDAEGKFRYDKLDRPVVNFGKHAGQLMQDVPESYWDWIAKGTFSPEVKMIAKLAKLKQFPTKKEQA